MTNALQADMKSGRQVEEAIIKMTSLIKKGKKVFMGLSEDEVLKIKRMLSEWKRTQIAQ